MYYLDQSRNIIMILSVLNDADCQLKVAPLLSEWGERWAYCAYTAHSSQCVVWRHAKKVESDYRKSDGLDVSPIQEKIVINAATESSESSDSSLSESSSSSQSDSLSD